MKVQLFGLAFFLLHQCKARDDAWQAYEVTGESSVQRSLAVLEAAQLWHYTYRYDRRSGRRQLGPMPDSVEAVLPEAITRVSLPVTLPNGTSSRLEDFRIVDWKMLFMHSVVATQEVQRQLESDMAKVELLEEEAQSIASNVIRLFEGRGKEWKTAAQLTAEAEVAEAEVTVAAAQLKRERIKAQHYRELLEARGHIEMEVRQWEAGSEERLLSYKIELANRRLEEEEKLHVEAELEEERFVRAKDAELLLAWQEGEKLVTTLERERKREASTAAIAATTAALRANEDLELTRIRVRGEEERLKMRELVVATFELIGQGWQKLVGDPELLRRLSFGLLALVGGLVLSWQLLAIAKQQLERWLLRPPLLRSVSRPKYNYLSWLIAGFVPVGARRQWERWTGTPKVTEQQLSGVVLHAALRGKLCKLVTGIASAHKRGAPLRHFLLHGPPGTGKSLLAERIAHLCGLQYAVISGSDLGPLGAAAVSELHRVFSWAKSRRRGLLLVLDEADAALADRGKVELSESARGALNTLLFHTGELSTNFMMVLVTSRPQDLDEAVLDRVDDMIELGVPDEEGRRELVELYYNRFVGGCRSARGCQQDASFEPEPAQERLAANSAGCSARDIAKVLQAVQAAVNGCDEAVLTAKLWDATVSRKLEEIKSKRRLPAAVQEGVEMRAPVVL
ncbi:unnamed protein product [Chrysoparadoxa australica]